MKRIILALVALVAAMAVAVAPVGAKPTTRVVANKVSTLANIPKAKASDYWVNAINVAYSAARYTCDGPSPWQCFAYPTSGSQEAYDAHTVLVHVHFTQATSSGGRRNMHTNVYVYHDGRVLSITGPYYD